MNVLSGFTGNCPPHCIIITSGSAPWLFHTTAFQVHRYQNDLQPKNKIVFIFILKRK